MLKLSCHCGEVRVTVDSRPDHINACNCTLCGKSGARWAYFHPSRVRVEGATRGYRRADKDDPGAEIRFCAICGSTSHFSLTPSAVARHGDGTMGVNMRLADPRDIAGVKLRFPDGLAWSGEGPFGHVREAGVVGRARDAG